MSSMLDWALLYSGQGFNVFPIHSITSGHCTCKARAGCTSPGKHPHWQARTLESGVKNATRDEARIRSWWKKWPNANIGIATGRVSGVLVVDIDGDIGSKSIKSLQRQCGKLPKTLTAQTGNGAHLFFRCGDNSYRSRTGVMPGVDIRADGGYVVAPPSVHIAGKRYRWSSDAKIAGPPIFLRQILVGKTAVASSSQNFDRPKPHVSPASIPVIYDGGRNSELCRWAGRWIWEDKSMEEVEELLLELNRLRCKPPLSEKEVRRILRSCKRYL